MSRLSSPERVPVVVHRFPHGLANLLPANRKSWRAWRPERSKPRTITLQAVQKMLQAALSPVDSNTHLPGQKSAVRGMAMDADVLCREWVWGLRRVYPNCDERVQHRRLSLPGPGLWTGSRRYDQERGDPDHASVNARQFHGDGGAGDGARESVVVYFANWGDWTLSNGQLQHHDH